MEDTHYFDESEAIEDWSESCRSETGPLSPDEVKCILFDFRPIVQDMAVQLVATPYDSSRLRQLHQHIDDFELVSSEEKQALKHFLRLYGQKERKRPRDRLLRDDKTKDIVMGVRKRTAFLGYTWQRMRPRDHT